MQVFGSLLKYLKLSIETCNTADVPVDTVKEEEVFQDAIVQSVGTFSGFYFACFLLILMLS